MFRFEKKIILIQEEETFEIKMKDTKIFLESEKNHFFWMKLLVFGTEEVE